MRIEAWTRQYRPFVMDGNTIRAIRSQVEAEGPHDLGQGCLGWLITAPDERTFVSEKTSRAVVGDTLEQVREDIRQGDPLKMARQVDDAARMFEQSTSVTEDEFWRALPRRRPAGAVP